MLKNSSLILFIFIILIPEKSGAEEFSKPDHNENEKYGDFLGGIGDRIFSIFGNLIENDQKQRQNILDKLAGKDGELSNQEIREFLETESEISLKEDNQAIDQLKKMYDPENGVYSGIFKLKQKHEDKKYQQVEKLDNVIKNIIEDLDKSEIKKTRLKLMMVKWVPIGDTSIDDEMSVYYDNIIQDLLENIN